MKAATKLLRISLRALRLRARHLKLAQWHFVFFSVPRFRSHAELLRNCRIEKAADELAPLNQWER
jgi:hypothetical protein